MHALVIGDFRQADHDPLGELLDAVYPDHPGQLEEIRHASETRAACVER